MLLNCGVVSFGTLRLFPPFSDVITLFVSPYWVETCAEAWNLCKPFEVYSISSILLNHLILCYQRMLMPLCLFCCVLLKILVSLINSGLFPFCCVPYWFSASFTWDSEIFFGLLLQPFDWIKKTFFEKPEPEAWVSRHKRLQVCNCNFDTPLLSGMIPDWRELG